MKNKAFGHFNQKIIDFKAPLISKNQQKKPIRALLVKAFLAIFALSVLYPGGSSFHFAQTAFGQEGAGNDRLGEITSFCARPFGDGETQGFFSHEYLGTGSCGGGGGAGDPCSGPRRAKAYALPHGFVAALGPIEDFGSGDLKIQPEEVCLTHLGQYDSETGAYVGDNFSTEAGGYILDGKYLEARRFLTFNNPAALDSTENPGLVSPNNDFRFDYFGNIEPFSDPLKRHNLHQQAGQVSAYYHITRFRTHFLDDQFIHSLAIPEDIRTNLLHRQFRPGFTHNDQQMVEEKPIIGPMSGSFLSNAHGQQNLTLNYMSALHRNIGSNPNSAAVGLAYDPVMMVGEYGGLFMHWLLAEPEPLKLNGCSSSGWANSVTACFEDATNQILGAWYIGQPEIYGDRYFAARYWCINNGGINCDPEDLAMACEWPDVPGSGVMPCNRGQNVDNVHMFVESANNYPPGYLPSDLMAIPGLFTYPFNQGNAFGSTIGHPGSQEKTALFFSGLFYDFAHEVGMGWRDSARLWFQTLHMVSSDSITMRQFGETLMLAAEALWPVEDFPVLHQAIFQAVTSRGIPLDGKQYFWENLPPTIGEPENFPPAPLNPDGNFWPGRRFGTAHPQTKAVTQNGQQTTIYAPWGGRVVRTTYEETDNDYAYMAYSIYKHSKFGPADSLIITDGGLNLEWDPNNPGDFADYNYDGSYVARFYGREAGNVTMLLPMNEENNRRLAYAARFIFCGDIEICSPYQDNNAFGFRVIQKMKNGFSFTAQRLSGHTYELTIEDPSLEMAGPRTGAASFSWEILDRRGQNLAVQSISEEVGGNQIEGYKARFTALQDQPVVIRVTRDRQGYAPDILEKVERGTDLDRDTGVGQGRAFVRNCLYPEAGTDRCL